MRIRTRNYIPILALFLVPGMTSPIGHSALRNCPAGTRCVVIDDFEEYEPEGLPLGWSTYQKVGEIFPVSGRFMNDRERFVVKSENGNQFVRAEIKGEAHRLIKLNSRHFDWKLSELPILSWKWRANSLPVGAREDKKKKNDTGGAVYVVFGKNWLGRPRIIKYTYSSSLSVGSTPSYGPLKILVVDSEPENGLGEWIEHRRNVIEDYERLFGKSPPDRPASIVIWSDSDTIDSYAEVDFDDIMLLGEATEKPTGD